MSLELQELESKSGTGERVWNWRASLELESESGTGERVWNWRASLELESESGTGEVNQWNWIGGSSESGTGQVDRVSLELDKWIE